MSATPVIPTPSLTPVDPHVIEYPASDGQPVAETPIHLRALILLLQVLEDWFATRPDVFVGADMFWYWEEGNPAARRAPDLMVVKGVGRAQRRSFFTWRENGAVPCFILELASENTWREDLYEKRRLYAELGVTEYFLFDPEAAYLRPVLQGYRRVPGGGYQQLDADGRDRLCSEELGVLLKAEGQLVRLMDGKSGEPLLFREEKIELERRRAEEERGRALAENHRAEELAAEVARLKALLDQKNAPPGQTQS
jgi:Uma2 family endonuclease